jgi:hypothetical protein
MSHTTVLILDGVLLAAIICVSLYGAATLPAGARVPVHFGSIGAYNHWIPKNIALVMWPAAAVLVYVILIVTTRPAASGSGPSTGLTIALVVMLVTHSGALRIAKSRGGPDQ